MSFFIFPQIPFPSLAHVNKYRSYLFDLAVHPSSRRSHCCTLLWYWKEDVLFKMCLWKVIIALWHLNWVRDHVIVQLSAHAGESNKNTVHGNRDLITRADQMKEPWHAIIHTLDRLFLSLPGYLVNTVTYTLLLYYYYIGVLDDDDVVEDDDDDDDDCMMMIMQINRLHWITI